MPASMLKTDDKCNYQPILVRTNNGNMSLCLALDRAFQWRLQYCASSRLSSTIQLEIHAFALFLELFKAFDLVQYVSSQFWEILYVDTNIPPEYMYLC